MKLLKLPHGTSDYLCPINGICDMLEWKTSKRIPDSLLFYISEIGFSYVKQKNAPVPRMTFWTMGLGKRQYGFLEDIMGFKMHYSEGIGFKNTLKKVKSFIEAETPVILFGLDMFHLPYLEKYYQKIHIPGHIILMVGYSDEEQVAFVYDNSRPELQSVPYSDLSAAWEEDSPGQYKCNTFFAIQFGEQVPDIRDIINKGWEKRARAVLEPPVSFLGIPGIRKLSNELLSWEEELPEDRYKQALTHFVTFSGSVVPSLPRKLSSYDTGIADRHQGARDRLAEVLCEFCDEYGNGSWKKAAAYFEKSGNLIGKVSEIITDCIIDNNNSLKGVPELLKQVADYEEEAYNILTK
ncbi:MAG: BtrH N-terminal domain-containing protein [Clostridia bacterium]|nr:BtrH N-terminal domain-containing protein [Clostridia bacterium]